LHGLANNVIVFQVLFLFCMCLLSRIS